MDFTPSPRAADLTKRVRDFIDTHIEPVEPGIHADIRERRDRGENPWTPDPIIDTLKAKARSEGLWNLFLPAEHAGEYAAKYGTDGGTGLTNLDYAPVAAIGVLSPQATSWLDVNLEPGHYLAACMVPFGTGYPHAMDGMYVFFDLT